MDVCSAGELCVLTTPAGVEQSLVLGIPCGLQGMNENREITRCRARGALKEVPEYLGEQAFLALG